MNLQTEFNRSKAIRVRNVLDHFVKPVTDEQYNSLTDDELIFESCTLEDIENTLFLGVNAVQDMMLEAITSTSVRLKNTMKAFTRALNKATNPAGITVDSDVEISKPRKSGNVAVMTARMSLSDGQAISVVFHAPDNDPLKINPSDTLIAFRFLLNSRDVTHVVAPAGGQDLSLAQATTALSNLAEKNSEKFKSKQSDKVAQQKEIEDSQRQAIEIESQLATISDQISSVDGSIESTSKTLASLQKRIDRENQVQEKLRKELEGLTPKAATTTNDVPNAGGNGEPTPEPTPEPQSVNSRVDNMLDEATQKITEKLLDIENAEPSQRKSLVKLANRMFGTGIAPKKSEGVQGQASRIAKMVQSSLSLQGKTTADFDQQFKNIKEIKAFMDGMGLKYKNNAKREDLLKAIVNHGNAIKAVTKTRLTDAVTLNDVNKMVAENKPIPIDDLRKVGITSTVYQLGDMALADVKNLEEVPPLDEQGLEFGQVRAYSEMIQNNDTGSLFTPLSNNELIKLDIQLQGIHMDIGLGTPVNNLLSKTIGNIDVIHAIGRTVGNEWVKSAVVNELTKRGLLEDRFNVEAVKLTNSWRKVEASKSRFKSVPFTDERGNKDFSRIAIVDTDGTNFRAGSVVPTSNYKVIEIIDIPDDVPTLERINWSVKNVKSKVDALNDQNYSETLEKYLVDIKNGETDETLEQGYTTANIQRNDPTKAIAASEKLVELGFSKKEVDSLDYWYEMAGQTIKNNNGEKSSKAQEEIGFILRYIKPLIKDATPEQFDALRDYVNKQNAYFEFDLGTEQESLFDAAKAKTTGESNHWYGMRIRPFGLGNQPDGQTAYLDPEQAAAKFPDFDERAIRFGAIAYAEPLSKKDIEHYNLTDLQNAVSPLADEDYALAAIEDAVSIYAKKNSLDENVIHNLVQKFKLAKGDNRNRIQSVFAKELRQDYFFENRKTDKEGYMTWFESLNLIDEEMLTTALNEAMSEQAKKSTPEPTTTASKADELAQLNKSVSKVKTLLSNGLINLTNAKGRLKDIVDNNIDPEIAATLNKAIATTGKKQVMAIIDEAINSIGDARKASLPKVDPLVEYADVIKQAEAQGFKVNVEGSEIIAIHPDPNESEFGTSLDNPEGLETWANELQYAVEDWVDGEAKRQAKKESAQLHKFVDGKKAKDGWNLNLRDIDDEYPRVYLETPLYKYNEEYFMIRTKGEGLILLFNEGSEVNDKTYSSLDELIKDANEYLLENLDNFFNSESDEEEIVNAAKNGELPSDLSKKVLSYFSDETPTTSPIDSAVDSLNELLANGANLNSTDYMAKMEVAFMAIDEAGKVEEYNDLMMDVSRQLDGIIDAESKR